LCVADAITGGVLIVDVLNKYGKKDSTDKDSHTFKHEYVYIFRFTPASLIPTFLPNLCLPPYRQQERSGEG
jgi:hypothetical protein